MKNTYKLFIYHLKSWFKIPVAIFFNILFPIFVYLFTFLTSTQELQINIANYILPSILVVTMLSSCVVGFSSVICTSKYCNMFLMYKLRGFSTKSVLTAFILSTNIVTLLNSTCIVIFGKIILNVNITIINFIFFLPLYFLLSLVLTLLGFVLGVAIKEPQVNNAVSALFLFILMFVSGINFDSQKLPKSIQIISNILPTTIIKNYIYNSLINSNYMISLKEIICLLIFMIFSIFFINIQFKKDTFNKR